MAQVVELCLVEIAGQHAHTAAVVANRCEPTQMAAVAEALKNDSTPKSYVLPEEPLLDAPTVADLAACRRRHDRSAATRSCSSREVMGVLVAGMTAEHVLERLTEGVAVITPGDRSDVVLAVVECPCRRRLSVAVVHHPQRRP